MKAQRPDDPVGASTTTRGAPAAVMIGSVGFAAADGRGRGATAIAAAGRAPMRASAAFGRVLG